jgi:predicted ferric reductase
MLTTSKSRQRIPPIFAALIMTMILWLGSKWYFGDWFDNPYKYLAKAASLTAMLLMCFCVLLATRIRPVEDFFGGLDKVYQLHKRSGKWAFYCILLHPLFLAADRLPDLHAFLSALGFLDARGDRYLWGHNIGVATLILMIGLLVPTLWIRIPYHFWKHTHNWFGLVMLFAVGHIVVVNKDVSLYPLLGLWMYGWLGLALAGFSYIRFAYQRWGPHYGYEVARIERAADILEISLSPDGEEKMDFKPSQFVYLVVHKKGITPEPHPYSIACGYNMPGLLKLGIKKTGDHTRSLEGLAVGDKVTVSGPYGHFSENFLTARRDCVFVGGGIGITPFLGMWHVAMHSEERLPDNEVPESLSRMHPEIIRSWKSPRVALFYLCRTREEACFDDDIRNEIILSHFHGFPAFEKRGHHYETYISSEKGRLTADYLVRNVAGSIQDKYIFLCGPSVMVDSLTKQFLQLGIHKEQIIIEDFNFLG